MSHSSSIPVAVSDFNQLFYGIAVLLLCYGDAPLEEHAVVGRILKIWDAEKHPDSFVFEGNTAVIVDFYANWCGPCQQLFPMLEKLANEYEGELIVYKVNKEVEENLASAFKVQGLPALLLIPKSGHPLKMYNGLPSEEKLRSIIEEQLLDKPKQK